MNKDQREIQRKLRILKHAEEIGSVVKTSKFRTPETPVKRNKY